MAKSKQYQLKKVEHALASLEACIEHLQILIDSYDEADGPFGSEHPRTCYKGMVVTLKEKSKALARGRV